MTKPTVEMYQSMQLAYDTFNSELFGGGLPQCLMTLQREGSCTLGYFSPERFSSKSGGPATDEIAISPMHMVRPDKEVLATIGHEMVHLWQQHNGKPGRKGYHNREWANKMLAIGLTPVNNNDNSKITGQSMHHTIKEGGAFERIADGLIASGWRLGYHERGGGLMLMGKKPQTRAKFTCPTCQVNAWAAPSVSLVCGDCQVDMESNDV